jgi:uncharacterized protein
MTRIGLLSDTHSYLDEQVFTYLDACDELWHAGDVGAPEVIERLKAHWPVRVVCGNIDPETHNWPSHQRFELEGLDIWMTHIGGTPPKYNPIVRPNLQLNPPDIFVCGHSHILKVARDPVLRGHHLDRILYLNPGAAGRTGFHQVRTCLRFTLDSGQIRDMQVIELGTVRRLGK